VLPRRRLAGSAITRDNQSRWHPWCSRKKGLDLIDLGIPADQSRIHLHPPESGL